MKSYVFTLTNEAQANPQNFLPSIEKELVAQGCTVFQHLVAIGCITAEFPSERTFGSINGVESVEETQDAYTQV